MNNAVRDDSGAVVGFRCHECGGIFMSMWDQTCNGCREKELRDGEVVGFLDQVVASMDPPK